MRPSSAMAPHAEASANAGEKWGGRKAKEVNQLFRAGLPQRAESRGALAQALAALHERGEEGLCDANDCSVKTTTVDLGAGPRSSSTASTCADVAGSVGDGNGSMQVDFGLSRRFESEYFFTGEEIGKGGFGSVRVVQPMRATAEKANTFACKSMPKYKLDNENEEQWQRRLCGIQSELDALTAMRGSLSVTRLEAAFEDEEYVHLVMERLRGETVQMQRGHRVYTEDESKHILRSVLRMLAQLHSRNIMHRDVKHSNFCFVRPNNTHSPIKAFDFGTAATFIPGHPRTDLDLQGTVHFEAPEALSGRPGPEADIWAVGVMAYQLLSGKMPFDDKRNPASPSATQVWKAILSKSPEEVLKSRALRDVSSEAIDFLRTVLNKDPLQRPTARQLLKHPFLQKNCHTTTAQNGNLLKRLQRFSASDPFRREVLYHTMKALIFDRVQVKDGTGQLQSAEDDFAELCATGSFVRAPDGAAALNSSSLAAALWALGYRVTSGEAQRLLQTIDMDSDGVVTLSEFAAASVDFASMLSDEDDTSLHQLVRAVFEQLAGEGADFVTQERVEEVLRSSGQSTTQPKPQPISGISFDQLMSALQKQQQSLSMYDNRMSSHGGSFTGRSSRGGSTSCRGVTTNGSSSQHNALQYLDCA